MSAAFKAEVDALGAQLDASPSILASARHVATSLAVALQSLPSAQLERSSLAPALLARLRAPRKKAPVFAFVPLASGAARMHVVDATANGVVRLVFAMPREHTPTNTHNAISLTFFDFLFIYLYRWCF
jgi:hypothetical protein